MTDAAMCQEKPGRQCKAPGGCSEICARLGVLLSCTHKKDARGKCKRPLCRNYYKSNA